MPYDALGNYIPGDDEPSLDQMRLALTQKQPTYTQIPGYDRPVPQADRPLDRATRDLKSIATNMNPLMLMKSMKEMTGTLAVNPMLMPANAAYELATGKPGTFYSQAQTPAGQAFEEDLGKLMDVAKVPHMWPLTPRPAGARPAITPNDVRVMGAEAARVGRQVRDIPTDFANAQSGVTRLDPVTNAPTLGARIGQAERGVTQAGARLEKSLEPIVTNIMERGGTSAAFLAAMAGQPLYAVRPKGTSLVTPTRMPTATTMSHPYDPVQKLMYDVLAEPQTPTLTPTQLQTAYERVAQPTMSPDVESAFNLYMGQRIHNMFPDAPTIYEANEAFIARFADPDTRQAERLKFIQDFITQTPEGQQSGLPLPSEIQARHEAAVTWLNGPFANYVKRNVGTEGDPLVKLASQGLTFLPDATIREMAADANYITRLAPQRVEAGFPAEGTFAPSIAQVDANLGRVRSEIAELEKRRSVLRDLAQSQGLLDPADMPEYAALTDPIRKKVRERDKLEEERIKLQTGQAYENLSDLAVVPKQAGDVLQNMDYAQRQFYPTLAMTPPGEKAYLTNNAKMRELGLGDVANAFYDDVLSGAIPLDKVQKTTVENYVRSKAQERVKAEAIAKAKEAEARAQAERNLKTVVQEVPNSMIFGNAAVIELNDRTPVDVAIRRVSEDTAILDHCVGEGGTARGDVNNPFTGKRQKYEPIIDLTTGQPNPKASKDSTAYIRALQSGEQLASIRDVSTGRPVATLQFSKSHLGSQGQQLYRIGYASGVHNGAVDPAYAESIRNYLNSRAGEIASAGDNLADNAGVYDTQSPEEIRALSRKLGVSRDMISTVDFNSLPRFVVAEDVSKALKQVKESTQPTQPAVLGANALQQARADIANAVINASQVALDAHNAASGEMLNTRVREHVDNLLPADTPSSAFPLRLTSLIDALTQDVNAWADTPDRELQGARTGMLELLVDLEGVRDHVTRQLDAQEAQARQPVQQGMRETDLLLPATRDAILNAFTNAYNTLDPINDGTSRVARMFSGLWSDIRDTHLPANATIANLRAIRTRLENTEAHYANRGTGEGDAMAEAISEILLPAINDILEQRIPPAEAAAMLMEPDDAHPAGPMPDILGGPDVMGIIDEVVTDTLNNDGLQVGERVETVVHRIAGQINPVSRTQEYIQALRDAADREQSERVELTLYDIADRIETQMIHANAPVVAHQQFARPDIDDMARDLLEDARIDNQRFNGADLQTTLQALETGNFDDARFRALPAAQQTQAQSAVAARLRELMQEANRLQAIEGIDLFPELQGQQQRANVARYIPIAEHAANMTFDQLRDALTPAEMGEVTAMHDDIVRNNPSPNEIRQIAQMVYDHQMGPWENQPDTARAMLYMELTYTANRMEQEPPQRRPQGFQDGGSVKAPGIMGSLRKMVALDTPQDMTTGETVADIAAGFVPGLGTAQSARDFERARREGDKLGMGLAAVGMLPVVGGMVKPVKATAKRLADATKAGPEVAAMAQKTSAQTPISKLGADVLYHGGTYTPGDKITKPLFTSPNKNLASAYLYDDYGNAVGKLSEMSHSAQNPASEEKLLEVAKKLGIKVDEANVPLSLFDKNLYGQKNVNRMMAELKRQGYDSAQGIDIGAGTNITDKAVVLFPGIQTAPKEVGGTFYRGIPRVAENDLSTVSGLHAKERKTHGITPGTRANTQNYAWASDNPLVAETYSHRGGVMVPMTLTEKPGAVFDAQGKPWHEWFYPGEMNVPRSEYAEALKDPAVKSILVKNILDPGGGVTDEAFLRRLYEQVNKTPVAPGAEGRQQLQSFDPDKYLLGNNLLVKDPSVMRYRLTGEKTEFAKGGTVEARQVQTSAQTCINKANGGTVSRTPSLDSMRLELMMRRK